MTRVCIIGFGLIGSSLARALKANADEYYIVACAPKQETLDFARQNGMADEGYLAAEEAVRDADIVVLATPIRVLEGVARMIAPHLKAGAIVTDVASVKAPVMAAIAPHLPAHVYFVPAHPIAGSEQTGVRAGKADLYVGKRVWITPVAGVLPQAVVAVKALWEHAGARAERMDAALHDEVYAYVSHLPQKLAFACAPLLEPFSDERTGNTTFAQFTRLCGSDPALWADIFDANKANLANALDQYLYVLHQITKELGQGEGNAQEECDSVLLHTRLFPRIVSSCLVAIVTMCERKQGISLASYAGTGFADMTAPLHTDPEGELELCSKHSKQLVELLTRFSRQLH